MFLVIDLPIERNRRLVVHTESRDDRAVLGTTQQQGLATGTLPKREVQIFVVGGLGPKKVVSVGSRKHKTSPVGAIVILPSATRGLGVQGKGNVDRTDERRLQRSQTL